MGMKAGCILVFYRLKEKIFIIPVELGCDKGQRFPNHNSEAKDFMVDFHSLTECGRFSLLKSLFNFLSQQFLFFYQCFVLIVFPVCILFYFGKKDRRLYFCPGDRGIAFISSICLFYHVKVKSEKDSRFMNKFFIFRKLRTIDSTNLQGSISIITVV